MSDDGDNGGIEAFDAHLQESVVEHVLADIWCDVLGVVEVRAADHFVELGGDSISAMLCLNRIRKTFSCDVEATALLADDMTFGELVSLVSAGASAAP